ncbi:hypothetical protein DB30_05860 [Enhygromyxa salina]|uniref:HEAT repeat protein n=1 Tax=Enhygromyxa salina TaxID=215803 RepID=A0A0C2CZX7_9BACT|nr:hypothetical protein DB30_05860 [Enhygromyxa salina]
MGLTPDRVSLLAHLERGRVGALALAAMQRNGWTRARALAALDAEVDELAVCVLVTRLNDPVAEIATEADRLLHGKRGSEWLVALIAALPLIETTSDTVRASRSELAGQVQALLRDHPRRAWTALARATKAVDADVRAAAIVRLARNFPEREEARRALESGLVDLDPRVRRGVAELIASGQLPKDLADTLLSRLELDRSPAIRLLGLRWRRKQADAEALLRACFDRNASLRHYARRYSRGVGVTTDYRSLALERLASMHRTELVGALATLSDVGRAEDCKQIEPLTQHPSRQVRDEARRTLALLRASR